MRAWVGDLIPMCTDGCRSSHLLDPMLSAVQSQMVVRVFQCTHVDRPDTTRVFVTGLITTASWVAGFIDTRVKGPVSSCYIINNLESCRGLAPIS